MTMYCMLWVHSFVFVSCHDFHHILIFRTMSFDACGSVISPRMYCMLLVHWFMIDMFNAFVPMVSPTGSPLTSGYETLAEVVRGSKRKPCRCRVGRSLAF